MAFDTSSAESIVMIDAVLFKFVNCKFSSVKNYMIRRSFKQRAELSPCSLFLQFLDEPYNRRLFDYMVK